MAQVKVTVNGRSVDMWLEEEHEKELTKDIRSFYAEELKGFRKTCRRPSISANGMRNVSRVVAVGNNSIRFA